MTKENYKRRTIRLSEETWRKLVDERWKSKKGWEKFIKELLAKKK